MNMVWARTRADIVARIYLERRCVSPPGSPPSGAQQGKVAVRDEKNGRRRQPLAPKQLDLLIQGEKVFEQKPHCQVMVTSGPAAVRRHTHQTRKPW